METEEELRQRYFDWTDQPLEALVNSAIASERGVASSSYKVGDRVAAIVLAVHPKTEPWKSRAKHYFDENSGNSIDAIKGASYSLVLNVAFELAPQGVSSVFVIYNPQVVIFAAILKDQIAALIRDYL